MADSQAVPLSRETEQLRPVDEVVAGLLEEQLPEKTHITRKPAGLEERLARAREKGRGRMSHEKLDPVELPRWARLAIAQAVVTGTTFKSQAKKFGKSYRTLQHYTRSPAAKKWIAQLKQVADDPEKLATALIRGSIAGVTFDYLQAMDNAIEAGDYREVGVMSRDFLDRIGITRDRKRGEGASRPTIVINLGAGVSLDIPEVESTYREAPVLEGDWELDE